MKMKRNLRFLLPFIIVALILFSTPLLQIGSALFSNNDISSISDFNSTPYKIEICADPDPVSNVTVATNTALGDFLSHLIYGKKNVSSGEYVESIMPGGTCPAHYDTTPSDVTLISEADLIACIGYPESGWLPDLLITAGRGEAKFAMGSNNIQNYTNPWLVPDNAIIWLDILTKKLNTTFTSSENITNFETNRANYVSNLQGNATEIIATASSNSLTGIPVLVMEWQKDFCEWLGLSVVDTFGSDESLSTQDIVQLAMKGQSAGVHLVISNLQSGTEAGAEIAKQCGAIHVIISNFPDAVPYTPTIMDTIWYNVEQMIRGNDLYILQDGLVGHYSNLLTITQMLFYIFLAISIIALPIAGIEAIMIYRMKKQ
ncbi:MAG: zinc ABC transporter substrate-binding protein [Candidatus Lokiarchaeota archaeon]|nr:zinc ABC transporter substrate-binding protein [Candidatus Lokiarchaeota archaeon]